MNKLTIIFMALALMAAATGCSTMYFHNGGDKAQVMTNDKWHHDGVFGLVEFSDPEDMNAKCEGAFKTIKVERTFINGLVRSLTYSLYDPWEVSYACSK
ncbi:MAG: hypothetical protein A2583_02935 [Bdellovibrionales bacterium RIFOXYD1_FULL_53_11]|nr:MAG: hypothetical protein A2583_02935 [Bdellovibrionales bacterium RIFOXYD1_FULL_53_11]